MTIAVLRILQTHVSGAVKHHAMRIDYDTDQELWMYARGIVTLITCNSMVVATHMIHDCMAHGPMPSGGVVASDDQIYQLKVASRPRTT